MAHRVTGVRTGETTSDVDIRYMLQVRTERLKERKRVKGDAVVHKQLVIARDPAALPPHAASALAARPPAARPMRAMPLRAIRLLAQNDRQVAAAAWGGQATGQRVVEVERWAIAPVVLAAEEARAAAEAPEGLDWPEPPLVSL